MLEDTSTAPSLLLLFEEFFLNSVVDDVESVFEFLSDLIVCGCGSLEPWVRDDITEHWSVLWRVMEHHANQVLELWREVSWFFALFVSCPVLVDSVDSKEFINFVISLSSFIERHGATAHDKKNATESKKIDRISLVSLSVQNFRCHVSKSTSEGSLETGAVSAFKRSSEAKVDHFAVKVVVKNDVFWF